MSTVERALKLNRFGNLIRNVPAAAGLVMLVGLILGGLLVYVPPVYLLVGAGALVFVYLLFFKIELAFIIALLIHVELARFNYMGKGTPFHPAGFLGVSLILGAVCYFSFRLNKIELSRLRPSAAFVGFFLLCCLSLLRSGPHLMERVTVLLRLAGGLAIYVVMLYTLDSIRKVKWTLGAIVASMVWPTLNGLFGVVGRTGLSYNEETVRLGHSNVGIGEAMMLTLCVACLLNARTKIMRLLMAGLTGLYAVGLFLSFGRAGWIGFVVAVMVMAMLKHQKRLLVLPVVLLVIILFVPGIRQRFSDISLNRLDDRYSSTLAGRIEVWKAAMTITKGSPIIGFGYGMGGYQMDRNPSPRPLMMHNDYLSVLLDTGLVGLILFLLWHGQWLTALLRAYRHSVPDYDQVFILSVIALLISSLVMRLSDNILLTAYRFFPLCALVGAALALPRIRAGEPAEVPVGGQYAPGQSSAKG